MTPVSLRWQGDASGHLELVDQTLLPGRLEWIACRDVPTLIEAIKSLRVRGAPAIGIAGGYGLVVAAG
ncbi:MAG: S-methyl-5-thioribose-1-phosphate isomerase, partial [Planctomycetota bacterium]